MNPFHWFRRRGMAPTGPIARQLEADLAKQQLIVDAIARLDAALRAAIDPPDIDTRPGTDHNALAECNAIYASGTANRRNTREENGR